MNLPSRKPNRLPCFDYSRPSAYFITICTNNRRLILWDHVGASIARPEEMQLSHIGTVVEEAILKIPQKYPAISVDTYVVMPNHIHLLLQINTDEDGRAMLAPTISSVVQQMKGYVTKKVQESIWQKSFYDHVVRGEQDYLSIWEYIQGNPYKWEEDMLYGEGE
ncbi:MAG: transposase [Oscillospiraceae bacterium]|nr:transposase [Oscillospiraceae bacterium]